MKPFRELTLQCQRAAHNCLAAVGVTLAGAAGGALGGTLFGTLFAVPFALLYEDASCIPAYQGYFAGCGAVAAALTASFAWWLDRQDGPAPARPARPDFFEAKPPRPPSGTLPAAIARRMTAVQLEL